MLMTQAGDFFSPDAERVKRDRRKSSRFRNIFKVYFNYLDVYFVPQRERERETTGN